MKRLHSSLRTTLPLALLAVLLVSVVLTFVQQRRADRQAVLLRSEAQALAEAEHLARSA